MVNERIANPWATQPYRFDSCTLRQNVGRTRPREVAYRVRPSTNEGGQGCSVAERRKSMSKREEKYSECLIRLMDEKLKELMSEEDYVWFMKQVAGEAFRVEIENCADEEIKKFVFDNWEAITGLKEPENE